MLIVCGPTGSGKSTTLYACLNEIDRFQKNVITVENPVEYKIENVTQIEVNPKAGKTFAGELRSILRQDPDVIYIGEIRDKETAEIACQAAQTGHMVFTTLARQRHRDRPRPPDRPGRAAVHGRRRRQRHPGPAAGAPALPEVQGPLQAQPRDAAQGQPARPTRSSSSIARPRPPREGRRAPTDGALPHCGGTGYHGRTGVFELLDADRQASRT